MYKFIIVISFFFFNTLKSQSIPEEEQGDTVACGGIERWAEKVLIDSAAKTINFNPIEITVKEFVELPTPPPSTSMKRFAGVEDKTYKIITNVTIKKEETDHDIHLVLSDGTNTFIGEIPDPLCPDAASSIKALEYKTAFEFVEKNIGKGDVKNIKIPLLELTGVAFVDPPHGQTGAAPNHLELHPILSIKFYIPTGTVQEAIGMISIFPNPFTESTHISIESSQNFAKAKFILRDLFGKAVSVYSITPEDFNQFTLSRGNLAEGMYLYEIISQGEMVYTGKLIAL